MCGKPRRNRDAPIHWPHVGPDSGRRSDRESPGADQAHGCERATWPWRLPAPTLPEEPPTNPQLWAERRLGQRLQPALSGRQGRLQHFPAQYCGRPEQHKRAAVQAPCRGKLRHQRRGVCVQVGRRAEESRACHRWRDALPVGSAWPTRGLYRRPWAPSIVRLFPGIAGTWNSQERRRWQLFVLLRTRIKQETFRLVLKCVGCDNRQISQTQRDVQSRRDVPWCGLGTISGQSAWCYQMTFPK